MLTGWYPKFKLDRGLDDHERNNYLPYENSQNFSPDEAIGMIRFNGTFIDFVDRTFKIKGMLPTLIFLIGELFFISFFLFILFDITGNHRINFISKLFFIAFFGLLCFGVAWAQWLLLLSKDVFQYTHYPVRFNRKTRKIYFFRHDGPGGTVTLPWGDPSVYFHIGQGAQNKLLRDLRCHVLGRHRQVQQTFTVGHFWDHENRVREEWELIRRYMEDGPDKCFDHPADRMIALSTQVTWHNCWLMVCLMMGTNLHPLRWNLMFPIYGALTLSRWLTMKSCRAPVFPPEVEAECAIEPGDPHQLPEPSVIAEFADNEAADARSEQRYRERQLWK
ncbi:DUF6708 domain-containing protein [Luteimonas terrae]|uniref:DUF6708 domain-containing protein n=1 Tax=Luteimonas terrae TaxID=1530191 RepID=A0ABU1XV74_9GAMM|nr:DUF6708 domain-containing protein [Luteimonas terrae]MDR7192657.1 hypothetical protein [Luteimonas terrae]